MATPPAASLLNCNCHGSSNGRRNSHMPRLGSDPSLGMWEFLRPFELPWQLQLSKLAAGGVAIGTLSTRGHWDFPELEVTDFNADLYKGRLNGHAGLDV